MSGLKARPTVDKSHGIRINSFTIQRLNMDKFLYGHGRPMPSWGTVPDECVEQR